MENGMVHSMQLIQRSLKSNMLPASRSKKRLHRVM